MRFLKYEIKRRKGITAYWVVLGCVAALFGGDYFDNQKDTMEIALFLSFLTAFIYTLVEYSSVFRSGHGYLIFGSPKLKGMHIVFGRMLIILLDILLYLVSFTIIEVFLNIVFRQTFQSFLIQDTVNLLLKVFTSFKTFRVFLLFATSFFLSYLFIFMIITFSNTILKRLNIWLSRLITIIMVAVAPGILIYSISNPFIDALLFPQLEDYKALNGSYLFWAVSRIHILVIAVILLVCAKVIDKNLNL
ncbi:hypothetical protein [Caldicellulosiruptor naganoensis]|uniref:ABC transporter permease n=1 Tax=Caldicellulosiruptor naganoensis TaxID=29324 RepID=A0ABY7BJC8_9FIRM|nr:hypothetical protein [Caldicellulosiruptor naganoensis]WAM31671.1 hypothetical protein OTJ99_000102 [Caldicellulosiruptor naganoensis]